MQRYCAEYVVRVRVSDVMITTDDTDEQIKEKIKKQGKENLRKWVDGRIIDPDGINFFEEVNITEKGL